MNDEMDEIWALYADDGAQALDAAEAVLDEIGDGSDQSGQIGALFRAIHTFKGNSRVLGLKNVETLAHISEDLIGLVRDEGVPLTEELIDHLIESNDMLRTMLEETAESRADVDEGPSAPLVERLRALHARLKGGDDAPEAEAPAPAAAPAAPAAADPFAGLADLDDLDGPSSDMDDDDFMDDEDEPEAEPEVEEAEAPAPAAAPAAAPAVGGFADLLAELGDSSSFDNDDIMGDDDGFAFEEVAEDDTPEPEPEPAAPVGTLAEVTEPAALPKLSEDVGYRDVFFGMVDETLDALRAALPGYPDQAAVDDATFSADGLQFASERLGLDDWVATIDGFLKGTPEDPAALTALIEAVEKLKQAVIDGVDAAEAGESADEAAPPEAAPEAAPEPEAPAAEAPAEKPVEKPVEKPKAKKKKKPKAKPAAEAAPEPEIEEPEVEEAEAAPTPRPSRKSRKLADDLGYRTIFSQMVDTALSEIKSAFENWTDTSIDTVRTECGGLTYAAEQIGLDDWSAKLDAAATADHDKESVGLLLGDLRALYAEVARDLPRPQGDDGTAEAAAFFAKMDALYPQLSNLGLRFERGDAPPLADREKVSVQLIEQADAQGYIRLGDMARKLAAATDLAEHRAAELGIYELLCNVEGTAPPSIFAGSTRRPSQMLGEWCAEHVFDTIADLRKGIEATKQTDGKNWFIDFEMLMRRVHYAAVHYRVETAAQLTMAILDLFARPRIDGQTPDVILLQMGRGYLDTMELVFDALSQGDKPDISQIEKMFEEAANLCFVSSGIVTARAVENRLGLPPEFHRVLSPESVKAAHQGMEDGKNFFIIRADLNDDDRMAQGFLELITSGTVEMITNVTVFLDSGTLFDFLITSNLSQDHVIERLALLDPYAKNLSLINELTYSDATDDEEEDSKGTPGPAPENLAGSLAILEAIGAISASHAMVDHELSALADTDLLMDINNAFKAAGIGDLDPQVRSVLRDCLEKHMSQLQEVREAGAQLSNQLSNLQQESVEHRNRPAEVFLRPMQAFVSTQAGKSGGKASFSFAGGDISLDQTLIEELRALLKSLISLRLTAETAPTNFHVAVEAEAEAVRLIIQDDGSKIVENEEWVELMTRIERAKGQLRSAVLPTGTGVRMMLSLPQHMIVLDGMVVRVGDIRYVLPIDAIQRILQTNRSVPIAAANNRRMLNMEHEGLVPICHLAQGAGPGAGQLARGHATGQENQLFVIIRSNDRHLAIPVDELVGQQLVLLRPLEGVLNSIRNMSGVAILSGGEVGMVVSVNLMSQAA